MRPRPAPKAALFHFAFPPAMASPKKRIPLNGPQPGLNSAFAGLQLEGLPEGPQSADKGVFAEAATGPKPKPGRVILRRLSAHRGGKTVLLVDGFGPQHSEDAIEALGRRLRAQLGCGGTSRERAIEVQGDQPARLRALLEGEGFQVAGER
jgi:translation initiation factor 1